MAIITMNTHSSICISGSKKVYFDPFEVQENTQDADLIFVTHEHHDHFDPSSLEKIKTPETVLVVPASMEEKAKAESGISHVITLAPGEKKEILGFSVEAVPAYNIGRPFHTEDKNWVGYLVNIDETVYYVAGDTDMNTGNEQVKCDVALLPVGGKYTMDKAEAVRFAVKMQPKKVIPTHFGTIVGNKDDGEVFAAMLKEAAPDIQVEILI